MNFIAGKSAVVNRTQCISIGIFSYPSTEPVKTFIVYLDKVAADSNVVNFTRGLQNTSVHIYNENTGTINNRNLI